ncbi:hypothetical protein I4U23_007184 [Adineta vaga]|nr:hypothetical protein I4U23_007184 [Adineta vaga]
MGSYFSSNKTTTFDERTQDFSQPVNPYVNKLHEITTEKELNQLITNVENKNILILCDFYAVWCQPCLQCAPILHRWTLNDYKTCVIFIKIDVDKNDNLANQYSINVLPTFVLFKQSKEIFRMSGTDLDKLKQEIDRLK